MLKLYDFFTNNGDWGGCHHEYAVAESLKEAEKKCPYSVERGKQRGVDYFVNEMTGYDVLRNFVFSEEAKKYNVTFIIEEKK